MPAYRPSVSVWEITMDCNMRCKHCGSGCSGPLPDELNTQEALQLAESLAKLGVKHITLSGGEPFTRSDWPLIARRLIDGGVSVGIITNGWLLSNEVLDQVNEVGIEGLGISVDGLQETHDFIRRPGSFQRLADAIHRAKQKNIHISAVTCIHRKNLDELPEMRHLFQEWGVDAWQLQAADPMGNLMAHPEWILNASDVDTIIDFAHDTMLEGKIAVYLADNIGYYHLKEIEVRLSTAAPVTAESSQPAEVHLPASIIITPSLGRATRLMDGVWQGCAAGKQVVGIRCNGDVIGCLSIRDDHYIEGNIRQTPLQTLWSAPDAFAWNRTLKKTDLTGQCRICQFGALCLGGCAATKITHFRTTLENRFCSYHQAMERQQAETDALPTHELLDRAEKAVQDEEFQTAEQILNRAASLAPDNIAILALLGYVNFQLENYPECQENNTKVLSLAPDNAYAHKGMGLCLHRQGRSEEGIHHLKESIRLAEPAFRDPIHDLATVYRELGRQEEATQLEA